jgi:polyhydroxybutyrate depolymerase
VRPVAERRSSTTTILVVLIIAAAVVLVGLVVLAAQLRQDPTALDESPSSSTATSTTDPGSGATTSTTSSTTPPRVDVVDHAVTGGLVQREYLTVAPLDVQPGERLPIVMVLHGLGVDRNAMLNAADWRGAVERDRFLAVFPQGIANSWNMGPCCPPANLLAVDDMAFLDGVLAEVSARPDADPSRRYLTGFSNGAVMVYAVACARSDVYLAVAPMAGSNLTGCRPTRPLSLLHQHSDPDPVVPFDGNPTIAQLLSSADFPDVTSSVAAWAAADGCSSTPQVEELDGGIERSVWQPCSDDTRVELVRLPGRGHNWPRTEDYDGLTEMLEFFDIS